MTPWTSIASTERPSPRARTGEPLLSFPSGALVHFAVSNSEVSMTTRLEGPATTLPAVQQGQRWRRGQPAEPQRRIRTSYLWEEVWERESWLEILGRYIVAHKDAKKQIKTLIFPRYHQLDATRKLRAAVLAEGPGRQVSDPAFGRLRQDELHRLVGAFPRRPARRGQRKAVLDRASSSPTAT